MIVTRTVTETSALGILTVISMPAHHQDGGAATLCANEFLVG
jgi:hypothetical protein